ncbi:MAG: dihydrolipoyl dehydrogenase [Oligoflexia bacterium]|nr:dihydrolipoyl dehydrogenase [Oligoflexia bacterium]MBF0364892.1 dihydrolipoyl dehydrogenase [Oligoflexia bacterium]
MSDNNFKSNSKLAVIGGGPGGYAAAFLAADLGMQVTLIDQEANPGGVCLYRGCIPSKTLLHIAKLITDAREAHKFGVEFAAPKIHLEQLRAYKESVVKKLTLGLGFLCKQRKVNFIQGYASFTSSKSLLVKKSDGTQEEVAFDKAIIASGSEATTLPQLASITASKVMDSTAALELKDIPASLLVVGGGYIGLELGSVYAALGSKVTVIEKTAGLLPGADRDLVAILEKKLQQSFSKVRVNVNTSIAKISEGATSLEVTLEQAGTQSVEHFDKIIVSIGRRVNTLGLGLHQTKVSLSERGFIIVDQTLKTADDNIYAIGDVVGGLMLAHKAAAEGKVAVEAILGHKTIFSPMAIPAVVFTDPELAWSGLTEMEASAKGIAYEVVKFPWSASGKAIATNCSEGLTKLIVEAKTEKILGVAMVGHGAGDMIAEGTLAIEMGAVVRDLSLTIHPHPTLSETMAGAAELFFGVATDMYRPKKK